MARNGNTYSRVVWTLKIALPVIAILMLSSIFILSRGVSTNTAIPFAEKELEERIRDQQVSNPFYTGKNEAGDDVRVAAEVMTRDPAQDDIAHLDVMNVKLTTPNDTKIYLSSNAGSFFRNEQKLYLEGDVFVETSDGYTMKATTAWVYDRGVHIVATGPIHGTGPATVLKAGHMEIKRQNKGGPMQIYFTQGVDIVYDPKKEE